MPTLLKSDSPPGGRADASSGSTKTAPAITSDRWKLEYAGGIGLQLPGVALQFESVGEAAGKLEMQARCAQRHPGYRNAPQLTVQGALVTGHDRDEVGVPVFPTAQTLVLAERGQRKPLAAPAGQGARANRHPKSDGLQDAAALR